MNRHIILGVNCISLLEEFKCNKRNKWNKCKGYLNEQVKWMNKLNECVCVDACVCVYACVCAYAYGCGYACVCSYA